MAAPAYPPARSVAEHVHAHMAREVAAARAAGARGVAAQPDVEAITAAIDTAFWASLRREEGYTPKISLAFLPRGRAAHPLTFARPIALSAVALARLAPAVERPGIHLGLARGDAAELAVWGTTRHIPRFCLVLEVVASGLLVLKYRGDEEAGKFVNVAVLEGDEVKVVDRGGGHQPGCPPVIDALLGLDGADGAWGDAADVLVQLAVSMRAHARGGTLLVVPPDDEWRASVVRSIPYALDPAFSELATLVRQPARVRARRGWVDAVRRAVDGVAGLTAVDGATVMTSAFDVLAFGAKITRRRGSPGVETVLATEPVEGSAPEAVTPTQLGGTRHLSAAQFVHDQRDALALVASQDGRFTLFTWAPTEHAVRAHRVETLLL